MKKLVCCIGVILGVGLIGMGAYQMLFEFPTSMGTFPIYVGSALLVISLFPLIRPLERCKPLRLLHRAICIVLALLAAISLIAFGFMAFDVDYYEPTTDKGFHGTAILLGCTVDGDRAGPVLQTRMDCAVAFLEENPEANCIVTGFKAPGNTASEAEVMQQYLVAQGISPERITCETQATTTEENFKYSLPLVENTQEGIVVITNYFHQYRAGALAKEQGAQVEAVGCSLRPDMSISMSFREIYAILKMWIF